MSKSEAIYLYTPLLQSIALRIVGSVHDAEDIVQDTFEKWLRIDNKSIQNTKAYLVRSVSNNSLKFLNSVKNRVSSKSLSEEDELNLPDQHEERRLFHFDLESQVDHAWSILHKKLEPAEKYIFVMREAFNLEYEELQHLFDKNVDHLRQIVSRAKRKLKEEKVRFNFEIPRTSIPASFLKACSYGHLSEMVADVKNEVVSVLSSKKK